MGLARPVYELHLAARDATGVHAHEPLGGAREAALDQRRAGIARRHTGAPGAVVIGAEEAGQSALDQHPREWLRLRPLRAIVPGEAADVHLEVRAALAPLPHRVG